jgi:hypothetical protein
LRPRRTAHGERDQLAAFDVEGGARVQIAERKLDHHAREIRGDSLTVALIAQMPRYLVAMFAYIDRNHNPKCVDATFGGTQVHLDRLAAAARMQ